MGKRKATPTSVTSSYDWLSIHERTGSQSCLMFLGQGLRLVIHALNESL